MSNPTPVARRHKTKAPPPTSTSEQTNQVELGFLQSDVQIRPLVETGGCGCMESHS